MLMKQIKIRDGNIFISTCYKCPFKSSPDNFILAWWYSLYKCGCDNGPEELITEPQAVTECHSGCPLEDTND